MYVKLRPSAEYFFINFINFIFVFFVLLFLNIENSIRLLLVLLLFLIHKNNLNIYSWFLVIFIKASNNFYINENNNDISRREITRMFSQNFRLFENFHKLPNYPTIIIANYCYDRLENLACIMIPKDITIVAGKHANRLFFLNKFVKKTIIKKEEKGNFETIRNEIVDSIKNNSTIFIYVNRFCHKKRYISRISSGMFKISKEFNIPLTPICIDYIDYNNGIIVPNQRFYMTVGNSFVVDNVREDMRKVRNFYITNLEYYKKTKYI